MAKEKKGEDHERLKKAYDEAKKKYNLVPTFEELNKELEIEVIDPDRVNFIIREIVRLVCDRLHKFIEYTAPIVNPHPSSLHSMIETKFFKKDEIKEMFEYYKRVWHLIHKGILASLTSEKDEAYFINEAWKEWPQVKSQMKGYMVKITECWTKEETEERPEGYLG